MKTIVYIDGYNLYYGLLKHTSFKWLDIYSMFNEHILSKPDMTLLCVKYYTADIKAKFSSHGEKSTIAQQRYHRALESPKTGFVKIVKGYYSSSKSTPMVYQKIPDKSKKTDTWKLEEKQTDVNLALDIYRDAAQNKCEQVVICTNDTDIAPALKYLRKDFPQIKIGVVIPINENSNRRRSASLTENADWVKDSISEKILKASQFPNRVPTNKKPTDKPDYW